MRVRTWPIMMSVGDLSPAPLALSGSSATGPHTTRCRRVVPRSTATAGVSAGMPCADSWAYRLGSVCVHVCKEAGIQQNQKAIGAGWHGRVSRMSKEHVVRLIFIICTGCAAAHAPAPHHQACNRKRLHPPAGPCTPPAWCGGPQPQPLSSQVAPAHRHL